MAAILRNRPFSVCYTERQKPTHCGLSNLKPIITSLPLCTQLLLLCAPSFSSSDGCLGPLQRVDANYPYRARAAVEGYCRVTFALSPTGDVENLTLSECRPKGYFEEAVMDAARQLQYPPTRVVRGVTYDLTGLAVESWYWFYDPDTSTHSTHTSPPNCFHYLDGTEKYMITPSCGASPCWDE